MHLAFCSLRSFAILTQGARRILIHLRILAGFKRNLCEFDQGTRGQINRRRLSAIDAHGYSG
ncbi:hypothetical protein CLG96_05330 [Sphingomonas oleivorans]|uniref:Uncharacterized protein n=1 Tax=Sphingomonas oleivorans TaxID=1735121 RepID=A0A2T5FZ75_9SPHN|nr:hypothetical protein CLG96_05330 [Sphingomonas oleivorans]